MEEHQQPQFESAHYNMSNDSFEEADELKELVPVHQSETGSVTSSVEG